MHTMLRSDSLGRRRHLGTVAEVVGILKMA
jgi:hypothetical protein